MTARYCEFLDGANFKGSYPFLAHDSHFHEMGSFKVTKNFTATNCAFWPKKEGNVRMRFSRTAWDSCKDCVFHGEVYINKQPAWNNIKVDSNLLLTK